VQLPLATAVALGIVLVALAGVRSRFLRGRLGFAAALLAVSLGLSAALAQGVGEPAVVGGLGRLLLVAAAIVAVVALLFNPWRQDRVSERVPAIVQDVVVVGFALQDTLGNLFAGLAIQIERPFRVGQWIRIGDFEGKVAEVTWRATKLLTKAGQFVIVPNSAMSKDAILNYSEPTSPTRIEVDVGASYDVAPNDVKRALHEALDNAPLVLREPAPDVILEDFAASAITYRVRFWIDDYGRDTAARDQVRTNIWYTFGRRGIEIPYPIQVEYSRDAPGPRSDDDVRDAAARLGGIDLFNALDEAERTHLARDGRERLFGAGERVVRQGDEGESMFVVLGGRVRVTIEPSGREVAVTGAGGVFGEMSMLTGDPRTATVTAATDARLLEITAAQFRDVALGRPALVDQVSAIVSARRQGLADAKTAADDALTAAPARLGLRERIQRFLRL
jgi:CRP-like cAMP-binding protein